MEEFMQRRTSNSTLPAEDKTFSNLNKESMKLPKFKYASEPKKKQRSPPMRDIENEMIHPPALLDIETPPSHPP